MFRGDHGDEHIDADRYRVMGAQIGILFCRSGARAVGPGAARSASFGRC
jgi:hypothetical protein